MPCIEEKNVYNKKLKTEIQCDVLLFGICDHNSM